MFGRLFTGAVIVLWLASMTWLLGEKVIPPLLGGDPPDYLGELAHVSQESPPDAWRLRWKERTIGFAASELVPRADGVDRHSFVEFEELPLDSLLSELIGPLSAVVKPFLEGARDLRVNLLAATRMRFNSEKRLTGFDTTMDLGDFRDFLKVQGAVAADGTLSLEAQVMPSSGPRGHTIRQTLKLPPEALLESSLAPRSQLRNLQVGQTWTIPVYRAFPPNSPVQILQAEVEKHDVIIWGTEEVEAFAVTYRADAGSGLHATREPVSREWVRRDGVVLRQEVSFSGLRIVFERDHEEAPDPRVVRLRELRERLWSEGI